MNIALLAEKTGIVSTKMKGVARESVQMDFMPSERSRNFVSVSIKYTI